jgi:F-type H+-transporting ATPase subunit epsilon
MTALREGEITVHNNGTLTRYRIEGGFADVTPEGLTVLAESATSV